MPHIGSASSESRRPRWWVTGTLTGADFGVPASQFRSDGELIANAGIVVDLWELARGIW